MGASLSQRYTNNGNIRNTEQMAKFLKIYRPANLKEPAWIPSKRMSALDRSQCGSINGGTDRRRTDGPRDVGPDAWIPFSIKYRVRGSHFVAGVLYEKPIPFWGVNSGDIPQQADHTSHGVSQ